MLSTQLLWHMCSVCLRVRREHTRNWNIHGQKYKQRKTQLQTYFCNPMYMWTAMRVSLPTIPPCSPRHTPFSHWLLASAVCGFRLLPPSPSLSSVATIFQIRDETRHMTIQVMLMSTWPQQARTRGRGDAQAHCTHIGPCTSLLCCSRL